MADDYVPTTEEVRQTYAVSLAEFDRWLTEYRNSVIEEVAAEIERYTVSSGEQWWMNDFQNEYELSAHIREMKG